MMVGAGDIRAGAAFVELYTKNSRFDRGLAAASRRLQAWGRQIATVSAVALAPLALATNVFARFDDQMRAVRAVTGATADEFQRLYDLAKLLGRTTSFTAAQVAGGQVELGRAGFKPAEIEASTASILALARATGTELPRSAEIAAGTLRAFNLEADKMTRVSDVLVATANNSAQTLEELGESMKYVAPVAVEYGLSLEDTAKALGVLANVQIKGTMAGTSMRQILLRLADPKIRADLTAMGVSLDNFGDTMIGLGGALANLPGPERLALIKELFDQRAAAAGVKLARTQFAGLAEAIDNAAGAAQKTSDQMDAGIGGALRRLWSAAEGTAIAIGESLAGAVDDLAGVLTSLNGIVTEWLGRNAKVVPLLAQMALGALAFGAALKTVGLAMAFLSASPAGAVFTAASVALVALGSKASLAEVRLQDLASAVDKSAQAMREHDAARAKMQSALQELGELADKHGLNNEEMERADTLIGMLQGAYGDLGMSVNRATGEIEGFAAGQAEANRLMREAAVMDIRKQINDLQAQREALAQTAAEAKMTGSEAVDLFSGIGAIRGLLGGEKPLEKYKDRLAGVRSEAESLSDQIRVLYARLRAVRAGEADAVAGGGGKAAPGAPAGAGMNADQVGAAIDEEHELNRIAIEGIEDRRKRELAAIDEKYRYERQQAEESGKQLGNITTRWAMEKANVEKKYAREEYENAVRIAEERERKERDLLDELAELDIKQNLSGHEQKMALLDLEEKRALEEANAAGISTELVRAKFDLLRAGVNADVKTTALGTFNPFEAAGLGAGGPLNQIEKNTKKTADGIAKIAKKPGRTLDA